MQADASLPAEPGPLVRAVLSRSTRRVAAAVLGLSFVLPVGGLGVSGCPVHAATGLPCPGCGMTRALAAATQGEWGAALGLHPFVLVVWPGVVALAALALLPERYSEALGRRLAPHSRLLDRAFLVGLAALLGFGALRLVAHLALREPFP